jgi:SSS family solute:Na+ symporter
VSAHITIRVVQIIDEPKQAIVWTVANPPMNAVDVIVLVVYVAGIVGMSAWFAVRQRSGEDYFLAGRRMGGTPLALSIVANQVSAVSLVGAPAFVAIREGGGLRWLQYELALPIAMLLLIVFLLPALRSVPASSIYAFGEARFGRATRRVLAGIFVVSRGLALGVILYASALVVSEAMGSPLVPTIVAIGGISVVYTGLGGIVADIWSDVVQLALLVAGTLVGAGLILARVGPDVLAAVPADRTTTFLTTSWGLGGESPFSLWPMLLGGLFLYVSYYGCDQSQAQRLLAARDLPAARRALLLNGLLRFPVVLTYCLFGLLLCGLLQTDEAFAAVMADRRPDSLVPTFITTYLPPGLRGLMVAGILAAAMSSIDSAMNSLAAVTLDDVLGYRSGHEPVWLSRATSFAWGLLAIGAGVAVAQSDALVIEVINQIGSLFYGPVLAVFVLGLSTTRVPQRAALAGVAAGLSANLALALLAPGVSWLWWNPCGFLVAVTAALVWPQSRFARPAVLWPRRETVLLLGAFVAVALAMAAIPLVLPAGAVVR